MEIELTSLLNAATEKHQKRGVFEWLQAAMREKVKPESLEEYLRRNQSLRGFYERARRLSTCDDSKDDVAWTRNVAACIRKADLEFTVDTRNDPWNRFPRGATVLVLIGIRGVTMKNVSKFMQQRAVGARDMEALIELSNTLNFLQTGSKLELQLLPHDVSSRRADDLLNRLMQRKDLGALIVIGSPLSNLMCDPMARAILGKDEPVARFRWAFRTPPSVLSETQPCKADEQGIRTAGMAFANCHRMDDDEVWRLHLKGRNGPFPDCGILMMNCRKRPFLILAAGHGGCGTKACVRALGDVEEISLRLSPNQQLFEVISAKRFWQKEIDDDPGSPTDLLDLPVLGGWSFASEK